ncbi:GMC family oxidoreductase [Lentzea roselyniae]
MQRTFDYVIAGAGSAGCVLANRLSEGTGAPHVALLEAGGPDTAPEIRIPFAFHELFKTEYDWNYTTTPQKELCGRELYWPRGKTLGGSSSLNAQMWIRGHRADFDGWAESCPGWSYDVVAPYFRRAERRAGSNADGVYGSSGPLWISELRSPSPVTRAFLRAAEDLGLTRSGELNQPDNTGFFATPVTQRRGRRWSTADAYLRPALSRANLHLVTTAHVQRVLLDGTRAIGVEYRDTDGQIRRVGARREVILSAGSIGSPQLLMLSGIGDTAHLRHIGITVRCALPGVGRNLQDHLAVGVYRHCPRPVTAAVGADSVLSLLRYYLAKRGKLTSNIGEAVSFIRSDPGLSAPDLELAFAPLPYIDHGFGSPATHGISIGAVLMLPKSSGRITLASPDAAVSPVIDPHYLEDQADLDTLIVNVRLAERLLNTNALRLYAGAPMDPYPGPVGDDELGKYIRAHSQTLYHPVGTCRMGTDDNAVVDPWLRVRGVHGLRVVDASVMPRITRGHVHAPTVMIAERAADFIRDTEAAG